jgi:hypothetical protein
MSTDVNKRERPFNFDRRADEKEQSKRWEAGTLVPRGKQWQYYFVDVWGIFSIIVYLFFISIL